jgi:hypothetical protein
MAQQRLQKAGYAFGNLRRVSQDFKYVGDDATLDQQCIVQSRDFRRDGVAF